MRPSGTASVLLVQSPQQLLRPRATSRDKDTLFELLLSSGMRGLTIQIGGRLAPRSGAASVLASVDPDSRRISRSTAIRGEIWVDFASTRQRFEENFAQCKSMCHTNFNSHWGHGFSPKNSRDMQTGSDSSRIYV